MFINFWTTAFNATSNGFNNAGADIHIDLDGPNKGSSTEGIDDFNFIVTTNGIYPSGSDHSNGVFTTGAGAAAWIIEYGNMAWVLYAGNHNILSDTYTNYLTYKTHIKYYYDKGIKVYDQFGTIGDLRDDNPLMGLHEFKKKFGGDYVEFTGEFDLVLKKIDYFVFTKLVPIYRNIIKKRAKKRRGM